MSNQPKSDVNPQESGELVSIPKETLRRLQRLATLGELTGTATHEFNNLLMTVMNFAKLGLRNRDEESRDRYLDRILAATQKASLISGTILAQARNRSDAMLPTDLAKILESTLVLMEKELSKYRIAVETEIASDAPAATANGNQIQSVMLNLMTNARQAMPEGGTLRIELSSEADGRAVRLSFRDSGVGISEQALPRIFDPFYSTKEGPDETGKGGTGLGLATCREVIEQHGGKIRVESTLGKGTQFTLILPAALEGRSVA